MEKIKYLGVNLTKEVQNLHSENCKILLKKLKKRHTMGKKKRQDMEEP